mgnify:CR=1 FL=1
MDREQVRIQLLSVSYEVLRLKSQLKLKEAERQYLQGVFDALSQMPQATQAVPTNVPEDLE